MGFRYGGKILRFGRVTVRLRRFLRSVLHFPAPNRAGWYQAIRMTLAALLADLATALVGMQHGYWAVITCLIIVQGSLGATIAAGIYRLAGTAAGVLLGGFGAALLNVDPHLPGWVVLLVVIAPLAVLAASRPIFRLAPFTGALVLLLAGSGDFAFAMDRVAEIGLGCVIGVLVSLFVLPERATAVLVNHSAGILDLLGEFAVVLLAQGEPPIREKFELKMRQSFVQIQNDIKEVDHERSVMLLRNHPFPEQLLRHLQRLRTDVNMLGRAIASQAEQHPHAELSAAIKRRFEAAAGALRGGTVAELDEALDQSMPDVETPLRFAVATLQHEFVALEQTLREQAAD